MIRETQHAAAAELALAYADTIDRGGQLTADLSAWGKAAIRACTEDALSGRDVKQSRNMPPQPWNPQVLRESHFAALDCATIALWRRHRVTYDIDPDLWDELADTPLDTVVPAGLMKQLAHPDPFIAFPRPMVLPMENGETMRVGGFFVVGRRKLANASGRTEPGQSSTCSTHSPSSNGGVGLLIGAHTYHADGTQMMAFDGMPDMIWSRVTLDTAGGDVTIGTLVENILARYSSMKDTGSTEELLPLQIRACVGTLIYLCARNAELENDAEAGQRAAKAHGEGKRKVKAPQVVRVGYRVGRALRAYKKRMAEESESAAARTGRRVAPHIRRGHPHTFLFGKGKTQSYVKWLPPKEINMDLDDGATVNVVPVTAQR